MAAEQGPRWLLGIHHLRHRTSPLGKRLFMEREISQLLSMWSEILLQTIVIVLLYQILQYSKAKFIGNFLQRVILLRNFAWWAGWSFICISFEACLGWRCFHDNSCANV